MKGVCLNGKDVLDVYLKITPGTVLRETHPGGGDAEKVCGNGSPSPEGCQPVNSEFC